MHKHIKVALELENKFRETSAWFQRTGESTIAFSTVGYCHMDQNEIDKAMLKAGCSYDFKRGVQKWDPQCGRTFSYFVEPEGEHDE